MTRHRGEPRGVDRRYTKKGFMGHAVNPPTQPINFFPAEMTNREKNEWRRERRQKLAEQTHA